MYNQKAPISPAIYQLKVTLVGARPPIWRRLLVPAELTLAQLHAVLQAAMDWENSHLHDFRIGRQRFGPPDPGGWGSAINERKARLCDVLGGQGGKAVYTYDFGDSWEHAITVEKVLPPELGVSYPACTGGKRRGPPEDCGGIGGYENLLEAIRDPAHEEHQDLLEWIGGAFDPEAFSIDDINRRLTRLRPRPRKA